MRKPVRAYLPALSLVATALVALTACGGGGGGGTAALQAADNSTTAKAAAASLYFTDDFSADYDAVWIGITKVVAVNAAGTETALVSFAPSKHLNLPMLRQAGTWAGGISVPGDAVAVRVYTEPKAQLQRLNGSLLDVTLNLTGGYLAFKLESWDRATGVLALDFDLPRFTLQGTVLTAATRVAGSSEYGAWNHRDTELKGRVTALTASSLTLDTGLIGSRVFVLDGNTSFVSTLSANWMPAVGDSVEVYGTLDGQGTDLRFQARVVKQRNASGTGNTTEVKGNVTAVNGSVVTLSVSSASTGGPTGLVTLDLAQAAFKRGSLASLAVGQRLEAYLLPAGAGWSAVAVEVDGAAKTGSGAKSDYAELKGRVVSVSGTRVTFTPTYKQRYLANLPAGDITVDLAGASFEKSALSCLVAGTPIEVKGYLDAAGAFVPTRVDAEGACASAVPAAGVGVVRDRSDSSHLNGMVVEAKGTITAVRPGELDITVFKLEGAVAATGTLTVRLSSSTYFEGTTAAGLGVGQFIEAKGVLQAGVLTASKVELD
jgi:hypothetical protein